MEVIGGFSINFLSEDSPGLAGESIFPGRFGKNELSESLTFLPQNLLKECCKLYATIKFVAPVVSLGARLQKR